MQNSLTSTHSKVIEGFICDSLCDYAFTGKKLCCWPTCTQEYSGSSQDLGPVSYLLDHARHNLHIKPEVFYAP